jgi:SAM-dependent methyltransferase
VVGDACELDLPGMPSAGTVDVVTFSYALTMIPNWQAALRNAYRMLKPGGHIAVCDFTVTKEQWFGMAKLWTWIFSNDHVHLSASHIPTLETCFETVVCKTGFGKRFGVIISHKSDVLILYYNFELGTFPYVPSFFQCPYYYYVGKKVKSECAVI